MSIALASGLGLTSLARPFETASPEGTALPLVMVQVAGFQVPILGPVEHAERKASSADRRVRKLVRGFRT